MLKRLGLGDILGELFRRPFLLIEAVRIYFATRRRRRLMPGDAYLSWRSYTAYGDHNVGFQSDDLIQFLAWRRRLRRTAQGVTVR
jgi:hypothetical protein